MSGGIGAWLTATGRFTIAGTAADLTQARRLMESLNPLPQIVILDISLEKENGLEFIPELKKISGNRKERAPGIIVCSMHEDILLVWQAMDLGARAYIAKSSGPGEILTAIDAVLAGNTYINPKYKIQEHQHAFDSFTPREKEIILLRKQLTNRQIAERINISVRTVESHWAHIYAKTGVTSWEELIKL